MTTFEAATHSTQLLVSDTWSEGVIKAEEGGLLTPLWVVGTLAVMVEAVGPWWGHSRAPEAF